MEEIVISYVKELRGESTVHVLLFFLGFVLTVHIGFSK